MRFHRSDMHRDLEKKSEKTLRTRPLLSELCTVIKRKLCSINESTP